MTSQSISGQYLDTDKIARSNSDPAGLLIGGLPVITMLR
jgi:hypothetical protein